ncbi:MAG: 3-isopropylmalate dehydratase small subunit [archaeon]|nr:3-isopropylmalate dehydratase small subunit [archaeon]
MILKGRAHVYKRDHINTDEIIPARYLNTDNEKELAKHAMEDLDPDFTTKVGPGDVIIAKKDFGCGSSREHAIWALRGAGIKAVIAESFARIYYRNSINNGLLAIECRSATEHINTGDEIEINVKTGKIANMTTGKTLEFIPIPKFALDIIASKGLLNYIKQNITKDVTK